MNNINRQDKTSNLWNKKIIYAFAAIILLLSGIYWYMNIKTDTGSGHLATSDISGEHNNDGIDFGPPTDEEKQAGDKIKEEIIEDQQNEEEQTNEIGKREVDVVMSDAGQYGEVVEVRAFTPDILQDGTCTIEFTQGNQTITKDAPAYADASSTICTNPDIQVSEFPSNGEWTVRVAFVSQDSQGQSSAKKITITK